MKILGILETSTCRSGSNLNIVFIIGVMAENGWAAGRAYVIHERPNSQIMEEFVLLLLFACLDNTKIVSTFYKCLNPI